MGTEFHLQVLTANFGGYQSLRLAAEELVRRHPTFSLETHDFFANEAQEWMLRNGITRYPTIRLYREGKLLGESSIAVWSLYSLEMWILGYLSAPGSAQFRSHRYRLLARYRPRRHRYRARRRRSWTPPEQIELYPDYPRDQFGFIPKPRCYEVLTVMADYRVNLFVGHELVLHLPRVHHRPSRRTGCQAEGVGIPLRQRFP